MLVALILDKMRPGIVLLSLVVLFMVAGIITPQQMVAGFSNRVTLLRQFKRIVGMPPSEYWKMAKNRAVKTA